LFIGFSKEDNKTYAAEERWFSLPNADIALIEVPHLNINST